MPVRGYRAVYLGLGLAQLEAPIRFEIEDSRPDPSKVSGPFSISRLLGGADNYKAWGREHSGPLSELRNTFDCCNLGFAIELPGRSSSFFWGRLDSNN